MRRSKHSGERVELLRTYAKTERGVLKKVFEDLPSPKGDEHVTVREIAPIHVRVPHGVSDNPRESAKRNEQPVIHAVV